MMLVLNQEAPFFSVETIENISSSPQLLKFIIDSWNTCEVHVKLVIYIVIWNVLNARMRAQM